MIGTTLGHFRITAALGKGGMGEVYRATDTRLNREVAIKVLPPELADDAERMARFEREAQVLASFNDPRIAGIHGLEHADGHHALVMELVEGQNLAERMELGPIPFDHALQLALQMTEGLEAAHDRGIIHRDLKPANVMLTPDGNLKLLDFGLAKALDDEPVDGNSAPGLTHSPTITAAMTTAGTLLGTAAYMSPEQARGYAADRRADIWAFGVVLMEMLSGTSVYQAETMSDTLAGVLAREPDWSSLPDDLPRPIHGLLERCLEKDLKQRLQAIGEARIAIERYLGDPRQADAGAEPAAGAAVAPPAPMWRRSLPWAALLVAGVVAIVGWTRSTPPPPKEALRLKVAVESDQSLLTPIGSSVVVSPEGRLLAYVAGNAASRSLQVRSFGQPLGQVVSGSDEAYLPFFSPDGEWIGFVTPTELKKVSVSGGTPLTLAAVNFCRGASWSPDGTIVFSPGIDKPLFKVQDSGGEVQQLTTLDEAREETTHRWPEVLPDGKAVLFVSHTQNSHFNDGVIEALDVVTGKRKVLVRGGSYPRYAASGHLVYAREGTLYAVAFDAKRLEVLGTPGPVIEGVVTNETAFGSAHYSVSHDGKLVYIAGTAGAIGYGMFWVDEDGNASPLSDEISGFTAPRFSPDGMRLAVDRSDGTINADIWVQDLERSIATRLTFDDAPDTRPVWSPDGEWIAFGSNRDDKNGLFVVASDGSGQARRLTENDDVQFPTDWSPDGRRLAYDQSGPDTRVDIWTVAADGSGEPELFLRTPFVEYGARFSPDGRFVAYGSNESGRWEAYVRPYPPGRGEWQISRGDARFPIWSQAGKTIYLRSAAGIAAVDVDTSGGTFRADQPRTLFEGEFIRRFPLPDHDVAPDGRFVLFRGAGGDQQSRHFMLVTDWFAELERAFPTTRNR